MYTILFRTVIVYALLICALRFSGKRQIGELEISELITTILLSELAAQPVTDSGIPLLFSVIPILLLVSLEVVITFVTTKSVFLKKAFDGKPSIIIRDGKLDIGELKKIRLSTEELLGELRLKGVGDIRDVKYAIFEQSGQLSVFEQDNCRNGIAHPVIIDGSLSEFNLSFVGWDKTRLERELKKLHIQQKDVFLMTVDDLGKIGIIKRDNI